MKLLSHLNPILRLFLALGNILVFIAATESDEFPTNQKYKIDGKVTVPFSNDQEWLSMTRILVDGGEYIGFLK